VQASTCSPQRDLGSSGLWQRSLARSRERRTRAAAGGSRREASSRPSSPTSTARSPPSRSRKLPSATSPRTNCGSCRSRGAQAKRRAASPPGAGRRGLARRRGRGCSPSRARRCARPRSLIDGHACASRFREEWEPRSLGRGGATRARHSRRRHLRAADAGGRPRLPEATRLESSALRRGPLSSGGAVTTCALFAPGGSRPSSARSACPPTVSAALSRAPPCAHTSGGTA
jgi:hypothetical protein